MENGSENLMASVHNGLVTCSLSLASTFDGIYVFHFILLSFVS